MNDTNIFNYVIPGLGTLICAFCLGPLIQFFNTHVSENVLQYVPTGQQA